LPPPPAALAAQTKWFGKPWILPDVGLTTNLLSVLLSYYTFALECQNQERKKKEG